MTTKLNERQLKKFIKESVQEAIDSEVMKIRSIFIPFVSDKEQKEIEKTYGRPTRQISRTHSIKI